MGRRVVGAYGVRAWSRGDDEREVGTMPRGARRGIWGGAYTAAIRGSADPVTAQIPPGASDTR